MKNAILCGMAAMFAVSCGQTSQLSPLKAEPGSTVDAALAAKVLGNYAIRSNLASIQNLPFVGKTPSLSSAYSLLSIERKGDGLVAVEKNCRVSISANPVVTQNIPDALPQSMVIVESPFRVWQDGANVLVAKDAVGQVVGATLQNPDTDALPTAATDARVIDQDKDGHPGVTVKISGKLVNGDIYLVQRVKNSWFGSLDANGQMSALLKDSSEQTIIDATSPLLKTKPDVSADPDASKSNVNFVKLADASYDCARLIQEIPTLWK